jgi:hypothetical protein
MNSAKVYALLFLVGGGIVIAAGGRDLVGA